MKTRTDYFRYLAIATIAIILYLPASAQRNGRGNNNRNYYRNSYYHPRNNFSVNVGVRNNYTRNPYSSFSRPYYNTPRLFTHFGPSFGVRVNVLPIGYDPFYIGRNPYYFYNGVYYQPYSNGGYQVVQAPLGATVKHLPTGSKVTVINGQKYYELGGTFYQENINEKNQLRFVVVGKDGVINTPSEVAPIPDINNVPENEATPQPQVKPEIGARFDKLPENSKQVVISKQKYYLSTDGVYYKEVIDGDNVRYEVTGNSDN